MKKEASKAGERREERQRERERKKKLHTVLLLTRKPGQIHRRLSTASVTLILGNAGLVCTHASMCARIYIWRVHVCACRLWFVNQNLKR